MKFRMARAFEVIKVSLSNWIAARLVNMWHPVIAENVRARDAGGARETGFQHSPRAAYGLAKKLGETSLIVPIHCSP
jgi:hypothetical protein